MNSIANAISGMLIAAAWSQLREARALLWWASAGFVWAIGLGLMVFATSAGETPLFIAGVLLLQICPSLYWGGTRWFVGRRAYWSVLLAGPLLATAVGAVSSEQISTGVGLFLWIVYLSAAFWELWRSREETLRARWGLMAIFVIQTAVYVGGISDVLTGRFIVNGIPPLNSWFGIIHIEGIFFAMGTAVFMVMMCKERRELGYQRAAGIDSLTQADNRGAFFERAERLFRRCRDDRLPLALILFDLDRFKAINDAHGHKFGDQVLRDFAATARGILRPNDLFGRYGGEEFVVILPDATIDAGYVVAERVRRAFAEACHEVDDVPLCATVSAGVAAAEPDAALDETIDAADRAMYRAKNLGRNRVERADSSRPDEVGARIIQVA